ncbi:MAG: hypothetical protein NT066_06095 [Candidatus Omnitrophica bacterium]|nr:hypothetical protein [Candidatus Omnitrophota bacterium]
MKNDKAILIIVLVLIGIIIFIGFSYTASLKRQNNALSTNIDQIMKRISALELTMEQVSALKAKNMALKIEIDTLKAELSRISQKVSTSASREIRQDIRRQAGVEKTTAGNKGFLIKDSKPRQ